KARIACINGRAARQQLMRKRRSAVVLKRAKQRIGVDLVAGASQKAATTIVAEVVPERVVGGFRAEEAKVIAAGIGLENGAADVYHAGATDPIIQDATAAIEDR